MKESELNSLKTFVSKINFESETAYDELFRGFTQGFNMPIIFVPIKKESFGYRSRNNLNGKDFCHFNELSYPDKKFITKYSRANKPGQQVFYSSDDFETNITELMPYWSKDLKIGDTFAITTGQWGFKKEIYVSVIPDFTNVRLKTLLDNILDLKRGTTVWEYWEYINSFFRAQGFYQPSIYKFTSAFCNALIHNSQVIDEKVNGILYTSIQNTSGWNLAILPKFVDENLELKSVFKLFLRKQGSTNGKPKYDNFLTPDPVLPKKLDFSSHKIIWE